MFRLFGFQVRVRASFFFMAAVLGMPRGFSPEEMARTLVWIAVVFVSILIHELGHAFAARGVGGSATIELYALGGVARHEHSAELSYGQRAWVSVAGPRARLTLGTLVFFAGSMDVVAHNGMLWELRRQLMWVNLGWGLLNLLPMLPLDGGHILHAGLDAVTGGRGTRATQIISATLGIACASLALYASLYWAAFIAGWCTMSTIRGMLEQDKEQHDKALWEEYKKISQQKQGDSAQTLARLQGLLAMARSDELRVRLVEGVAWLHLTEGREEQAVSVLSSMPGGHTPSDTLKGALLFSQGRVEDAIPGLKRALEQQSTDHDTWDWGVNALCEAYMATDRPEEVVALLRAEGPKLASSEVLTAMDLRLFEAGQFHMAAQVGELAFSSFEDPVIAYNVACSHARIKGSQQKAITWLNRAVDEGWDDLAGMDADPDFESLREMPEYEQVRARIGGQGD